MARKWNASACGSVLESIQYKRRRQYVARTGKKSQSVVKNDFWAIVIPKNMKQLLL
jgi:hypothetical protein